MDGCWVFIHYIHSRTVYDHGTGKSSCKVCDLSEISGPINCFMKYVTVREFSNYFHIDGLSDLTIVTVTMVWLHQPTNSHVNNESCLLDGYFIMIAFD